MGTAAAAAVAMAQEEMAWVAAAIYYVMAPRRSPLNPSALDPSALASADPPLPRRAQYHATLRPSRPPLHLGPPSGKFRQVAKNL